MWPSAIPVDAQVWRVLDLAGLTSNVRESKRLALSGGVYVDGNQILTLQATVPMRTVFEIEIRLPGQPVVRRQIFLVEQQVTPRRRTRC